MVRSGIRLVVILAVAFAFAACPRRSTPVTTTTDGGTGFCALPGSLQSAPSGLVLVAGGQPSPDISYLNVPIGFCAHFFANVGDARQLRFAPSGELFVASPTTTTDSGGRNGQAAIVILPDDNHDGYADGQITYLSNLPSTQGMLFAPGAFYYQDHLNIMRVPYQAGDRSPSGSPQTVASITYFSSSLHWPKTLDAADDGTIYVGNGGNQTDPCVQMDAGAGAAPAQPFLGGILSVGVAYPDGGWIGFDGGDGVQIASGFRNPIAVRCARGHDHCFALELARDVSGPEGGREKLVPIRAGDDWGFACCATTNIPYSGVPAGTDCSAVATDTNSFLIGETPFGLDFEPGLWPTPWTSNVFVVLHGHSGTWKGARVIAIPMDSTTGLPLPSNDLDGNEHGMSDFATGWDDGTLSHGRPAAIAFSADGRLFLADDITGDIVWMAPIGL
jgi:glucose/arabinose dehydrogenase